jgi:hypothetical protein
MQHPMAHDEQKPGADDDLLCIARHGRSCIQYSGAAVESMNEKHVALPHLFGRSRGCGPEEALARGGRT